MSEGSQANPARRILVVDDNDEGAESLALLLKMRGHSVSIARDGPGALVASASGDFDFILLDIGLPGMDGYAVARELRRIPRAAHTCIVALTGHVRDEDRERARDAGCDLHLAKPVTRDQLDGLIAGRSSRAS